MHQVPPIQKPQEHEHDGLFEATASGLGGGLFRDMQREQTIDGSQADIAALKG